MKNLNILRYSLICFFFLGFNTKTHCQFIFYYIDEASKDPQKAFVLETNLDNLNNNPQFCDLRELRKLTIKGWNTKNESVILPDCICNFKSLKSLIIIGGNSIALPECINDLNELEEVKFEYNRVSVPDEFYKLTSIKSVHINSKVDTSVAFNFDTYEELISITKHRDFDERITELRSIENVNFIGDTFPSYILDLPNLKNIQIKAKDFEKSGKSFVLPNLQSITLDMENMHSIPEWVNHALNLKELNISNNKISGNLEALCHLEHLKYLDVSKNPNLNIPKCLTTMNSLKLLRMSENQSFKVDQTDLKFEVLIDSIEYNQIDTVSIFDYETYEVKHDKLSYFLNSENESSPAKALIENKVSFIKGRAYTAFPDELKLNEESEVHLTIGIPNMDSILFLKMLELNQSENIISKNITIGKTMTAKLYEGSINEFSNCDILALQEEEQYADLLNYESIDWKWKVKPTNLDSINLILQLNVNIYIDNKVVPKSLRLVDQYFQVINNNKTAIDRGFDITIPKNDSKQDGQNIALLIAVQNYMAQDIIDLKYPLTDLSRVSNALISSYEFDSANVSMLVDPTKNEIIGSLEKLLESSEQDKIIIFFAGHGKYDKVLDRGYWLPSDALEGNNNRGTWFSNSELKDYIRAIKAKHVFLVSDACFSGSLFEFGRSSITEEHNLESLISNRSRLAITSGLDKEVPDKSIFTEYFIKSLENNKKPYITATDLFQSIRSAVIYNTQNNPQFGVLQNTKHEGGEFVFIKKLAQPKE